MTKLQEKLMKDAENGPVLVHGGLQRAARSLEKAGKGKLTSNPGTAYCGPRHSLYLASGGYYYVGEGWKFCQVSKCWQRACSMPSRNYSPF